MYEQEIKRALCIEEKYNDTYLKNLKKNPYLFAINKKFADLSELFVSLEKTGLKTKPFSTTSSSISKRASFLRDDSNPSRAVIDQIIAELDSEIKKANESNSTVLSSQNNNYKEQIPFQIEVFKAKIYELTLDNQDYSKDEKELTIQDDSKNCFELRYLDKRIRSLYRLFLSVMTSKNNLKFAFSRLKMFFKQCVDTTIKESKIDSDSLEILRIYGQSIILLLSLINNVSYDDSYEVLEKEAISYIAYLIGDYLYVETKGSSKECLFFAKNGLNIHQSRDRYDAFNNLGLIALESGDLQLSNDVYVSWIKQKVVGDMQIILPGNYQWKSEEKAWRLSGEGKKYCAIMNGNLAYVCGKISDTYELDAKQGKNFYDLALEYILKAKDLDPKSGSYNCTYGSLLLEERDYNLDDSSYTIEHLDKIEQALEEYSEFRKKSILRDSIEDKLSSYRLCCTTLMNLIFAEVYNSKDDIWKNKKIYEYYRILKKMSAMYYKIDANISPFDTDLNDEIKSRNELLPILNFCGEKRKLELVEKNHILLIAIRQNATILKEYLRRREYTSTNYYTRTKEKEQDRKAPKKVAYYTTLKNVSYIFDELYLDEHGKPAKVDNDKSRNDTKNCLTVMNAKYMNDPTEGVVLLDALTKRLSDNKLFAGKTANEFTRSIFDDRFVFLKSFTEQIDKLTMWNRYANDYEDEGKNSNGCCVLVAPECFVNSSKFSESEKVLLDEDIDDYNLYRVVYLSSTGLIIKEKNRGLHKNVFKLFENLKSLVSKLNDCLNEYSIKHTKDEIMLTNSVEKSLNESLRKIVFLFKYDDYSDEQESRLIIFRNSNHQDDIKLVSGDIPMLALNPFFQIYVKGIILGPNVRSPEKWRPYFHYQLNRMWNKHTSNTIINVENQDKAYTVECSDIKYMT